MRRARAAVELRIVALDRGGDDDHRGVADIGRVMADEHGRALLAQALDVGVVARVRALHLVAEVEQHLGDAGHADAADADEMDGAELARQFHAFKTLSGPVSRVNRPAKNFDRIRRFHRFGKRGPAPRAYKCRAVDRASASTIVSGRPTCSHRPSRRTPKRRPFAAAA